MRYLLQLLALASALLLASCGGGDGCAGAPIGSPPNGCGAAASTTGVAAVAKFVYTLDKNTITNGGADTALLTVTALDANNNVIVGAAITVSLSSGSYVATVTKTDAQGQVNGKIGIGGDYSSRAITATFTDGNGVSGTAAVMVTGAALTISATPSTPPVSTPMVISIKAGNVTGAGVPNASIQLSGLFTGTVTTDSAGNATVNITSPAAAGLYPLTATALGVTQTVQVNVGSAAAIPNVTATISGANLAINPVTIAPNSSGVSTSQAQLRALFTDPTNLAIQNVRVRFEFDTPPFSPSGSVGESISSGAGTVYSDASGVAVSTYIAGTVASATNGVHIRACYGPTDASIAAGACPNVVKATLTVASAPVSITLGTNNLLAKDGTGTLYTQTLVVIVNDSAGVAVSGATITGSVDITHYGKGFGWCYGYWVSGLATPLVTAPPYGQANINASDTPTNGSTCDVKPPVAPGKRVWCANEDYNRNGILDGIVAATAPVAEFPTPPGTEDVNGNGVIDPRKADVTIAFPNGHQTNAQGTLVVTVTWPMNVATWEAYTVTISTLVSGTEGTTQQTYVTSFILGDETNGSFNTPPYGVNNCKTAN